MTWRFCTKLSIALGFSFISVSSFSAQTIYGLQKAGQFRGHSSGNFYIQLGSFKSKSNAARMQASLQKKSGHPVSLKEKNGYYVIVMGPVKSAAEVRSAAQRLGAKSVAIQPVRAPAHVQKTVAHSQPRVVHNTNTLSAPKSRAPVVTHPVAVYKDKDGVGPSNRWFVGAGIGWMDYFNTDSTRYATSGMPGFPEDRYETNRSGGAGQYTVLGGYQWRQESLWFPAYSLSLEYTYISSSSINGVIFENSLADAKNFAFKYAVSQQVPMAKLKVDLYRWQQVMPYVSAGAGATFNRVHGYSEWPIPGATLQHRRYGFTSATNSQFAGSLGAGLDCWIGSNAQLSLGYELSYYGNGMTGYGQGVLSPYRLGNKLNSNAVALQSVYFFD